jgi:DNA polymerase III delta prime subunit
MDVTLDLREGMPRSARYAVALGALISDMHRQRQGARQITLEDGVQVPLDRGHFGYSFAFTEDADLFEDARVELRIGARGIEGQILSISGDKIVIAVDEDLGETIAHCTLVIDNTALLEALKERLEKAGGEGRALNTKLADSVVSNSGKATIAEPLLSNTFETLNGKQKLAIGVALANEVTYLWGPPGTGKTKTLSLLIKELFDRNKRVLICSNTNKAVDQVLLTLCKELRRDHPAMEKGQIVRLGRIPADEELSTEYSEFVTLDGIVERRSRDLQERKTLLEASLEGIARRAAAAEETLNRFTELDSVRAVIMDSTRELVQLTNDGRAAVRKRDAAERRFGNLDREFEKSKTAGALRRVFLRSEKRIAADVENTRAAITAADADAARLLDLIRASKQKADELILKRDDLSRSLGTADRAALKKRMEEFASERQPLLDELTGINKALADIEAAVMRDASVIGATVTKVYLSAKDLPAFDVVVIDEASMVILPALYFAVGLAREKAVISGDFRQLPPIVQTEQKAILDEIGMDVFHAAGVVEAVDASGDPRLVMLEEQYRMHKAICGLISDFMYKGKLRSSASVIDRPTEARDPLSGPLTIIDTSSLWPFETQTASFSRYNLVHALVVRNLLLRLHEAGHTKDGAFGVCTPYAAQAKLIRRLIEDEKDFKDQVSAGTVHRYQGDERTAIIIDIPESVGGGRSIGRFLQGDHEDDDGAKLLNVAVSRAKEHLVIVANLTYLDDRLPSGALLRKILFQIQTSGQVLDAREILSLQPADLRGLGRPVDIDLETQRTGLFKQKDFDTVFRTDVSQAKASVVIFSGFVTPERVGSYGDLFRQKILEGVKIRCVTRPPKYNGSIPPERGKEALDALEGIGVVVDCRRDIHQKIVIVDDQVVWFGSLNPLSHTAKTDEVMMRALAPGFASELARQIAIRTVKRDDGGKSAAVQSENPRCGKCGGRTFYFWSNRLRRPFFACEADCKWVQDATSAAAGRQPQQPTDDLPAEGPPCPQCGQTTRRRWGRRGPFYGCSRYPKCGGTVSAAGPRSPGNQ